MSYSLDERALREALQLPADERYDYFVRQAVTHNEIWSLADGDEWVVLRADDQECLPVWPHPDMAATWAREDWAKCKPAVISLDVWLERWLPGMSDDDTCVAVMPDDEGESVVVDANELQQSMVAELRKAKK